MDFYAYTNRTMCKVLEEMRQAHKTRNYSYLSGLIEELQVMGNRMESSLEDKKDVKSWREERTKLKKEIVKLKKKKQRLERKK